MTREFVNLITNQVMRKTVVLFGIAVFLFPLIVTAEEITLTLEEAIAIGLRDNRVVLINAGDVLKAKQKIREARAGLFPSLSVTGEWADTRELYSKDTGQTTARASLKQPLYTGGRTINTIQMNKYGLVAAQSVLDRTKLELALNIRKAFFTLLLARDLRDVNKKILKNTQEHVDSLSERYRGGQASESDMLRLQASLSDVRQGYEASVNQVEAGAALLCNILSLEENTAVNPDGVLSFQPQAAAYDEAFLKALKNRPEIRQYEAQRKAGEKAVAVAKADGRPGIYASWDYYSRSHVLSGTARGWNDYNIAGITVSWPVFDGWATKAKVEQAIVDLKEAGLLKEKAAADIALELKNAYLDLRTSLDRIKSVQSQEAVYKDSLAVMRAKYGAGIVSFLDVQDALLAYEIALFNEKQAVYDYVTARAIFDKAMGG
jgi:outer membrane protein TolC